MAPQHYLNSSPRFRDVLPADRRMSFLPSVESPQEWSLLRIMRYFYHLACARLKKAEASGLRSWLCQRCLFQEHATLSSPQPSTTPSMKKHLLDERELPMDSPNCVDNADNVLMRISQLRRFYRIPIRIPKSCRFPVADAVDRTITSASNTDWNNLVSFPMLALGVPISPNNAGSSPSSVQI